MLKFVAAEFIGGREWLDQPVLRLQDLSSRSREGLVLFSVLRLSLGCIAALVRLYSELLFEHSEPTSYMTLRIWLVIRHFGGAFHLLHLQIIRLPLL